MNEDRPVPNMPAAHDGGGAGAADGVVLLLSMRSSLRRAGVHHHRKGHERSVLEAPASVIMWGSLLRW